MDRAIVYLGQVPRSADVLALGQNTMTALAKLSEAVIGTGTAILGFAVTPTTPASLNAILGPGQVYQQENLEATAISGLAVDTHTIVKQGLLLDPVTLTFVAPTTIGFAQNFLIEVQYADADAGALVLPYANPANPQVPFNGPGNAGTAQNTVRKGAAVYQIKAGIAATSGTQVTPTPDAGWVGVAVVTLAYGQTTITGPNITPYFGAPTIPLTLPGVPLAIQSGKYQFAVDTGVANALQVTLNPSNSVPVAGQTIEVLVANNNNGGTTITVNGGPAAQITIRGGPLTGGELKAGRFTQITFDGTYWQITGIPQTPPPQTQVVYSVNTSTGQIVPGTFTYTVPPNVTKLKISVWGAGGAGGGVSNSSSAAAGGGGGGFAEGIFTVTPGSVYTFVVGAGAPRTAAGAVNGAAGQTSSFGSLISATGGAGGLGSSSGAAPGRAAGGVGIGGSINLPGGVGRSGFWTNLASYGGDGGSSWCSGEIPFTQGGVHDGEMPGQGGAGASSGGGAVQGSAGSPGAVFIECVG